MGAKTWRHDKKYSCEYFLYWKVFCCGVRNLLLSRRQIVGGPIVFLSGFGRLRNEPFRAAFPICFRRFGGSIGLPPRSWKPDKKTIGSPTIFERIPGFPVFQFSSFPLFHFSTFPVFHFFIFPFFHFSIFPFFHFSIFPFFQFSSFPLFSTFPFLIHKIRFISGSKKKLGKHSKNVEKCDEPSAGVDFPDFFIHKMPFIYGPKNASKMPLIGEPEKLE